jgi:hypothetical protein
MLYKLHLYDSSLDPLRKAIMVGTTQPGIIWTGVASYQDIENELRRIGGLGGKIDELWFHAHGAPGIVAMPTYGPFIGWVCLDVNNVGNLKNACLTAMAPQARVFFVCCSVGKGPQGEAFLLAAGPAMLGTGGGSMFAATSTIFAMPLIGVRLPLWGHVRVAKVSPGGATVVTTV